MCKNKNLLIAAGLVVVTVFSANSAELNGLRVLSGDWLQSLAFSVNNIDEVKGVFKSTDLKRRLNFSSTILIVKAPTTAQNSVWFTDKIATHPFPINDVTAEDFEVIWGYAESGKVTAPINQAIPVVYETRPQKYGPPIRVFVNPAFVPSLDDVKTTLSEVEKIQNPEVKKLVEYSVGSKLTEVLEPNSKTMVDSGANRLATNYRNSVLQSAIRTLQTATWLPDQFEPIVAGKGGETAISIARAIKTGAKQTDSFKTPNGQFDAVWDKSTLILMHHNNVGAAESPHHDDGAAERSAKTAGWVRALNEKTLEPHFKPLSIEAFESH